MNVLVTGAAGFIGSHLCQELVHHDYQVFGLSLPGKKEKIIPLLNNINFHLQTGDIRDLKFVCDLIKENQIKVIFHLAARLPDSANLEDPFTFFDINALGTLNILNAAYLGGVDRFIYASTMSVYAEPPQYLPVDEKHPLHPTTIYAAAKLTGETLCSPYMREMNITILRYAGAYGHGQRKSDAVPTFTKQALENKPITIFGDGKQTSDFVYIDDVVHGTFLTMESNKTGIFNIGSGEETSIKQLAERIIDLTNSKSKLVLTGNETERPFRFFMDIKKAEKAFGYRPLKIEKGLSLYIRDSEKSLI